MAAARAQGPTHGNSDTAIPAMTTNLFLAADETVSLALAVSEGTVYTLDLSGTNHVTAYLRDRTGRRIGKAMSAYGLTWTATQGGSIFIDLVNGPVPGVCRLGIYTNNLPFYRAVSDPDDHPPFMTNRWYEGSEFGYVHVPASRSTSTTHSFRLPVIQMPHGTDATNGPMVFLSGGPGASAITQPFLFGSFTNTCRVILMNQRGTYMAQPDLSPISPDETLSELQSRLGGPDGMDFNTINTHENAADVHDVMAVLGYNTFNIWGTSYGTMLAQEVMRQQPGRLRAVVLDGVVTMDQPQWTTIASAFHDAVSALINDVAQDEAAARLYPDFGSVFYKFAASLYPDKVEGFFDAVFHQMNFSRWGFAEYIPSIIWRAARGELAALGDLHAIRPLLPDLDIEAPPIAENMYCIVLRQDFLPFESMTNAAALTNTIPFPLNMHGYDYSRSQYDYSTDWAFVNAADPSFRTPVTNNVPVLIMNGTYDTQTSTRHARHVAAHLPHAYYVELPFIGHVVLFGGEIPARIARDFLANPHVFPDTNGIARLTFAPPWPAAPTNVTATAGDHPDRVRLTWNAATGATSYQVWRHTANDPSAAILLDAVAACHSGFSAVGGSAGGGQFQASSLSYDDTSVTDKTTYYYWVRAANVGGKSEFSSASAGYPGVVGPLVSINGMIGDNIRIPAGTPLTIAVEVMHLPTGYTGHTVDWWVAALQHEGDFWFYLNRGMEFTLFDGQWVNMDPAYTGLLENLPRRTVTQKLTPEAGTYNVWFALSYPATGVFNLHGLTAISRATLTVEE